MTARVLTSVLTFAPFTGLGLLRLAEHEAIASNGVPYTRR